MANTFGADCTVDQRLINAAVQAKQGMGTAAFPCAINGRFHSDGLQSHFPGQPIEKFISEVSWGSDLRFWYRGRARFFPYRARINTARQIRKIQFASCNLPTDI
jgi:hypothetical protein